MLQGLVTDAAKRTTPFQQINTQHSMIPRDLPGVNNQPNPLGVGNFDPPETITASTSKSRQRDGINQANAGLSKENHNTVYRNNLQQKSYHPAEGANRTLV